MSPMLRCCMTCGITYADDGKGTCVSCRRKAARRDTTRKAPAARGYRGPGYRPMRDVVIRDQARRCGSCRKMVALSVHHIDGNTSNNQRANLVALCRPCHNLADEVRRKLVL